jgi:hypothetical protein
MFPGLPQLAPERQHGPECRNGDKGEASVAVEESAEIVPKHKS